MRAFVVIVMLASTSGCCTVFNGVCDCISCLLSGPRLPGIAADEAPQETAVPAALAVEHMRY